MISPILLHHSRVAAYTFLFTKQHAIEHRISFDIL